MKVSFHPSYFHFCRLLNTETNLKPKAVSETEEQDLAQLMAKAEQENEEVSGDEEEDEGI